MTQTPTETRANVREHYGQVARTDGGCGCGPGCCGSGSTISTELGYDATDLAELPKGADMGLGCGTPLAFAALTEGEIRRGHANRVGARLREHADQRAEIPRYGTNAENVKR